MITRIRAKLLRMARSSYLSARVPYCNAVCLASGIPERAGSPSPAANRSRVDLVICTVAAEGELTGLVDLIDSARCYLDGSYRIVVVDDSGGLAIRRAALAHEEVHYLRNWSRQGYRNVDRTLRKAYLYALRNFRFGALMKMDADALITGPGLVREILHYLDTHPRAGVLGSHRRTCTGAVRDFTPIAAQFERNRAHWEAVLERAGRHGYEPGEHAQGGAYVLSPGCVKDMYRAGYLTRKVGGTSVAEDGIFSLFARSLGYEIHDFAYRGPFAIAWQGLPVPKEEVARQGKKMAHSIKYGPRDLEIRAYFSALRNEYRKATA